MLAYLPCSPVVQLKWPSSLYEAGSAAMSDGLPLQRQIRPFAASASEQMTAARPRSTSAPRHRGICHPRYVQTVELEQDPRSRRGYPQVNRRSIRRRR